MNKANESIIITQLRMKNFKCFKNVIVPLRKLTIVYGQNSSGKSTILQAIDLLRLARRQILAKESKHSNNPDVDDISQLKFNRVPWMRSGFKSLQRDPESPISVGITFRIDQFKKDAEGKEKHFKTYVTIDFVLDEEWENLGRRGGGLPHSIKFGFLYHTDPDLDHLREQYKMPPDIDLEINMETKPIDANETARRQYGTVTFLPHLVEYLSVKAGNPDSKKIKEHFEQPQNWGKTFYFGQFIEKPQACENEPGYTQAFQWANASLKRAWEVFDNYLKPELLLYNKVADSLHIAASEIYTAAMDKTILDVGNTAYMLRPDMDALLSDDNLVNRVNNVLQNILETPHALTKEGVIDSRCVHGKPTAMPNVGYGIQYLLPRLMIMLRSDSGLVCIEEPEAHVHPGLQAKLGRLLLELCTATEHYRQIIVESHSENLLLRAKRLIYEEYEQSEGKAKEYADNILALYVDHPLADDEENNEIVATDNPGAKVSYIRLDHKGNFADYWPKGFFPERDQLYY